jgi:hypothetical protein
MALPLYTRNCAEWGNRRPGIHPYKEKISISVDGVNRGNRLCSIIRMYLTSFLKLFVLTIVARQFGSPGTVAMPGAVR